MTTIKTEAPTKRETASLYRGRPIIVELHPGYLTFRLKGTRKGRFSLSYAAGLEAAIKADVIRERLERLKEGRKPRMRKSRLW
jgi:hypothetical protein